MNKVRTRFAPSPTGYLHIGNLRTALFAFLIARSGNGKFILRIEDTDQKREIEGAKERLLNILDWSGFSFDEGPGIINKQTEDVGSFGPYIQTDRREIYDKYKNEILKKDGAYCCFCSAERLQAMREDQQANKKPPRYDRKCRDLSPEEITKKIKSGEKYVIRQKMPLTGEIIVHDELRGDIKFNAEELEDHVLIKSNGIPTYQFAAMVDDYLMEISHVVRGEEYITSFPKNILLYKAFGWEPPKFIHMPLILNKAGGGKLSKRQGDVAVEDFRDKGYLPEAIINFCVHLGWHSKSDNEIFTLAELEKEFNYKDIGTSPAIFDTEKLDYFNGYYIRHTDLDKLVLLCRPYLKDNLAKTSQNYKKEVKFIKGVVRTVQERLKILSEIGELTEFFFVDKLEFPKELLAWKKLTIEQAQVNLKTVAMLLEKIPEENWTDDSIEEGIVDYLKKKELKIGEYLWPMRVALTGLKASPGPFEAAEVLGKKESLSRVNSAIDIV